MKEDPNQLPALRGLVQNLTKDLRKINGNDTSSMSDMFSALGKAYNSLENIPNEELKIVGTNLSTAVDPVAKALGMQSRVDEIITVGQVVVTYRPNLLNMNAEQKEKIKNAITAILTANPGADLDIIQGSLSVTIKNVQRPGPSRTQKGFNG